MIISRKKCFFEIIGLLVLITISITVFSLIIKENINYSSQSDYPMLKQPLALDVVDFTGTDMLTYMSDVIVEGKINEILPSEENNYNPQESTPESQILEKLGQDTFKNSFNPVKIQVISTLKGEEPKEIILYRSVFSAEYEPELKKGETMIFFLNNNKKSDNVFSIIHPHAGYFYVSEDNKVYPAELTSAFEKDSGKGLNDFKQNIISYVKSQPVK